MYWVATLILAISSGLLRCRQVVRTCGNHKISDVKVATMPAACTIRGWAVAKLASIRNMLASQPQHLLHRPTACTSQKQCCDEKHQRGVEDPETKGQALSRSVVQQPPPRLKVSEKYLAMRRLIREFWLLLFEEYCHQNSLDKYVLSVPINQ